MGICDKCLHCSRRHEVEHKYNPITGQSESVQALVHCTLEPNGHEMLNEFNTTEPKMCEMFEHE